MRERVQRLLQKVPLEIVVIAAVFVLSLFLFSFIVHEAVYKKEDVFDQMISRFFALHSSPGFIAAMKVITFFGSTTFLFPAYIVLVVGCLSRKDYQNAVEIAVIGSSSTAMMFALKQFFQRQRPQLPIIQGISGYSFPSGHALSSFIFCSILIYLVRKGSFSLPQQYLLIILLVLWALLIGLSRIVLNVHYATDVIGGFCMGFIWVTLSFAILKRIRKSDTESNAGPAS